jgi:Antitoxin Xre/MbcA/ParS C-terminal toxin-binding domain
MSAIAKRLEVIQRKGGMKSVDIANVLGTTPETVSRWNQGRAFPRPTAREQIVHLEYVVDQLADFYDPEEINLWLISRQKLLGGKIPAELIQEGRIDEVIRIVEQLRQGAFI